MKNDQILWSKTNSFNVDYKTIDQVITLQFSENGEILNPPQLTWPTHPNQKDFKVKVSRNKDFSGVAQVFESNSLPLTWHPKQPGKYYWRYQLTSSEGTFAWSPANQIDILLTAPQLVIDEDIQVKVNTAAQLGESFSINAPISWKAIPLADRYRVQVKKTRDILEFKNLSLLRNLRTDSSHRERQLRN